MTDQHTKGELILEKENTDLKSTIAALESEKAVMREALKGAKDGLDIVAEFASKGTITGTRSAVQKRYTKAHEAQKAITAAIGGK